jgi:hypothetical protein
MGEKMKKILLLILLTLTITANEVLPTCKLTAYSQDYQDSTDDTFVRFKEASFLDKESLTKYAKKLKIDIKDLIFASPSRCDALTWVDSLTRDDKIMGFEYSNTCDFAITYKLDRGDVDRFKKTSVVWTLGYKDKCKISPNDTYFINEDGTETIEFQEGKCMTQKCYYQKHRIIFISKINNKKYLQGAEVQYLRQQHSKERFKKLSKSGKVLENNATSWACIEDTDTNLIWENKSNEKGIHYFKSKYKWGKWEDLVNASNQEKLCGFDDWRVPNNGEVHSLIDYRFPLRKDRRTPIGELFFSFQGTKMWSTTSVVHNPSKAYYVPRRREFVFHPIRKTKAFFVVLVRGKETIPEITGFKSDKTMNVE